MAACGKSVTSVDLTLCVCGYGSLVYKTIWLKIRKKDNKTNLTEESQSKQSKIIKVILTMKYNRITLVTLKAYHSIKSTGNLVTFGGTQIKHKSMHNNGG